MNLSDYHLESKKKLIRLISALFVSHTFIFVLAYTLFHQAPAPIPSLPEGHIPLSFDAQLMSHGLDPFQEIAIIIDEKKNKFIKAIFLQSTTKNSGFEDSLTQMVEVAINAADFGLMLETLRAELKPRVIPYLENLNLNVVQNKKEAQYEIHF